MKRGKKKDKKEENKEEVELIDKAIKPLYNF